MKTANESARLIRRKLRIALDLVGDRYYSIDTVLSGSLPSATEDSQFHDSHPNGPVSYWILKSYIDFGNAGRNDVFYDIGCGDGRVLCMMARHPIAKCVGIELGEEFAAKARKNVMAMRGRVAPVEVFAADATTFDYSDGTLFYFGDPFGPDTMRVVLKKIGDSVAKKPRSVTCMFVFRSLENATAARPVLETSGWLRPEKKKKLPYSPMRVEYWVGGART